MYSNSTRLVSRTPEQHVQHAGLQSGQVCRHHEEHEDFSHLKEEKDETQQQTLETSFKRGEFHKDCKEITQITNTLSFEGMIYS